MTGAGFIILVDCLGKFTHPELIDEISSDVTDMTTYQWRQNLLGTLVLLV